MGESHQEKAQVDGHVNDNEFGEQDTQYTEPSDGYLVCGFEIGQCSSYGVEENLSISINLEFRMRGIAQPKSKGVKCHAVHASGVN